MAKAPRKKPGTGAVLTAIREENPGLKIESVKREEGDSQSTTLLLPDMVGKVEPFIRLFRRNEIEKDWVFHGRLSPEEATTETIIGHFGGGYYKLIGFARNEIGQHVFAGSTTVRIPGAYKPPTGALPGMEVIASNAGAPGTPAPGSIEVGNRTGPAEALNTALVASVVDLMKSLRSPQPVPTTPSTNWSPVLLALIPLVQAIIVKLLERKDDSGGILGERLQRVEEALTKAQQQPGPASNAIGDAVKAIKELLAVKDMIDGKGSADPESMMFSAIPRLLETMATAGKGGQQKMIAPGQPGAGHGLADATLPAWHRLLLAQKANIVRAASFGMAPETAAEVAVQMMPKQVEGVAREFLQRPDCAEVAVQVIPELTAFPHFVSVFFAEMRSLMFGDGPEAVEEQAEEEGEGDDQPGGP